MELRNKDDDTLLYAWQCAACPNVNITRDCLRCGVRYNNPTNLESKILFFRWDLHDTQKKLHSTRTQDPRVWWSLGDKLLESQDYINALWCYQECKSLCSVEKEKEQNEFQQSFKGIEGHFTPSVPAERKQSLKKPMKASKEGGKEHE